MLSLSTYHYYSSIARTTNSHITIFGIMKVSEVMPVNTAHSSLENYRDALQFSDDALEF